MPPDPIAIGAGGYALVKFITRWTRTSHAPCHLVIATEHGLPWERHLGVHTTMDGRIEVKLIAKPSAETQTAPEKG